MTVGVSVEEMLRRKAAEDRDEELELLREIRDLLRILVKIA